MLLSVFPCKQENNQSTVTCVKLYSVFKLGIKTNQSNEFQFRVSIKMIQKYVDALSG